MNINILSRLLAPVLVVTMAAAAFSLASCGGDDDPDGPKGDYGTAPYTLQMRVVGNDGQNLLDPKNANTVVRDSITAVYEGNVYQLDTTFTPTRVAAPVTYAASASSTLGLRLYAPAGTREFIMFFGEFEGDKNVDRKDVVIQWNDGSANDTVSFSHSYSANGGNPQVSTTVWLNHKPATLPVTFTKDR